MKLLFRLVLLSLVIAGCSQIKTAYKYADWAIEYRVDDYFDLDEAQEKELKIIVAQTLANIKEQKMELLATDLQNLSQKIEANSMNEDDFSKLFFQLQQNLYSGLTPTLKPTSELIANLSDKQMSHFEVKFSEYDEKLKERIRKEADLPERKRGAFRAKKFRKRLLKWSTTLSKEADKALLDFYTENRYPTEVQIENRAHLFTEFKRAKASGSKAIASYLVGISPTNNTLELKSYKKLKKEYFANWSTAMSQVVKKMTPKERRRLAKVFRNWSTDLNELSRGV